MKTNKQELNIIKKHNIQTKNMVCSFLRPEAEGP